MEETLSMSNKIGVALITDSLGQAFSRNTSLSEHDNDDCYNPLTNLFTGKSRGVCSSSSNIGKSISKLNIIDTARKKLTGKQSKA